MRLQAKLKEVQKEKKALLACNFYNFETCKGILKAASNFNQPVILQLTENSIEYMGIETAVSIARTLSNFYRVQSWIHLDHCKSIEMIKKCLDAGFDSVMIDASDKSFPENIRITTSVVKLAEQYKANVEAELGYIPKPGESDNKKYTEPKEAKKFVDETNVNALAVAVGSKHGFYSGTPELNLNRLKAIRNETRVCLVLHGGSGIPKNILQKAIYYGFTKVNLATEIKDVFMKMLKKSLRNSDEIDLRKMFPPSIEAVRKIVEKKLKTVSFYALDDK